jgi:electron transfer flavoprotein alpha subunit
MQAREDSSVPQGILVFAEVDGDRLSPLTLELLGAGARLAAGMRQALYLVHLGAAVPAGLEEAFSWGADEVYAAVDPLLAAYQPDLYLQAAQQAVAHVNPSIILFGQSDMGLDLAPRLAFKLRTGVTLDCLDLAVDGQTGLVERVKPVFGGKAHATFRCDVFPQIVSLRQGSFDPPQHDGSPAKPVLPLEVELDASRARSRLVKKVQDEELALALDLVSAPAVVTGGRGLKDLEGVESISRTAALLGGAIGATRAAVESGLLPRSVLVGLTGRRVNPRLYMAVGVSGSLHHMAGCMRSRTIVAVNTDESAPIFMFSHIGVVGDYRQVLKGFNDEAARILTQTASSAK